MPEPGRDFDVCGPPSEKAMQLKEPGVDIDDLDLSWEDWASIGIIAENGAIKCQLCKQVLPGHEEVVDHISIKKKRNKRWYHSHFDWLFWTMKCWRRLQRDGWRLKSHGVCISQKRFHCKACSLDVPWQDGFAGGAGGRGHIWTNKHLTTCWRNKSAELAKRAPAHEQQPWDEMLSPFTHTVLDIETDQLVDAAVLTEAGGPTITTSSSSSSSRRPRKRKRQKSTSS